MVSMSALCCSFERGGILVDLTTFVQNRLQLVFRIGGARFAFAAAVKWVNSSLYSRAIGWLAIAVAGTMLPLYVVAQTQPGLNERDAERQQDLIEKQRRAGESSRLALPAEDDVTYGDVLKDPDNIDLNFRYAKAQIARGNVRGAAGTLERILLITPDLVQVRLIYAIVLFRLDSIDEAEREFRTLRKLKMAANLRTEIDGFLSSIKLRRQKTKTRTQLSFGVKYDSNVNAAPRDGQALVVGIAADLTGRSRKQHDFATLGIVSVEVAQDLGHQARDEMLFSASYYHDEQFAIDSQDLQSASASLGMRLRFENVTMTPKLQYTNLRLSREKYYSSYGGEILLERRNVIPALKIDGHLRARVKAERFHSISETSTAPQQTGTLWEWEAALVKKLTPKHTLSLTGVFTRKLPLSDSFNDYRGHNLALQHTWILSGGKFLLTSLDHSWDLYKTADDSVTSSQVRHDNRIRFRLTYGMSLDKFIVDATAGNPAAAKYFDFLRGFTWTVTGEILDQNSNIRNFDYRNRRTQTMLTRAWNF